MIELGELSISTHRISSVMRIFCVLLIAFALAACGGGESEVLHTDTTVAETPYSDRDAVEDTAEVIDPAPDEIPGGIADDDGAPGVQPPPDEADGGAAAEAPSRSEADASSARPPLAARYRLAYVEGEPLPVTIDENPDCRVELVQGELRIREDRSFELTASSRTTCGGELINDDRRQAEGRVDPAGDRLHFEATSGEFFAAAQGSFTDNGHINVDTLEFGGEAQPVDWRFLR